MRKNKLLKHLKAAASSDGKRAVLECLHFDKDGSYIVTDSHVLLRLEHQHHLDQDFNLNLSTFEEDQAAYPETKNLIPTKRTSVIDIKKEDLSLLTDILKGQSDPVEIDRFGEEARLSRPGITTRFGLWQGGAMDPISFNPKYLLKAVSFFDDYLTDKSQIVSLSMITPLRPIVMRANDATYLVTPVRRF